MCSSGMQNVYRKHETCFSSDWQLPVQLALNAQILTLLFYSFYLLGNCNIGMRFRKDNSFVLNNSMRNTDF